MPYKPDHTPILLTARSRQFGKSCLITAIGIVMALAGCSAVAEKTNMLSDTEALQKSAAALGYEPGDLTLVKRSTIGDDTYLNLQSKKGHKEFTCVINGGGIFEFGMTNPPSCAPKGSSINTNSLQK